MSIETIRNNMRMFPKLHLSHKHCGQLGHTESHSLRQPGALSGAQEKRFLGESHSDLPSLYTLVH